MRKKTLEYDGQKYVISPLSMKQVDAIAAAQDSVPANDEAAKNFYRDRAVDTIIDGLNNAQKGEPDAQPWTRERVEDEIDIPTFEKLQTEILVFSGLKVEDVKPAADGETKKA